MFLSAPVLACVHVGVRVRLRVYTCMCVHLGVPCRSGEVAQSSIFLSPGRNQGNHKRL